MSTSVRNPVELMRKSRRQRKLAAVRQFDGEDVAAPNAEPQFLELHDTVKRRIAGKIRAVDRTHTGADDEIRVGPVLHERMQHPNLHRAETSAARKNERRPRHRLAPLSGGCIAIQVYVRHNLYKSVRMISVGRVRLVQRRNCLLTDVDVKSHERENVSHSSAAAAHEALGRKGLPQAPLLAVPVAAKGSALSRTSPCVYRPVGS